MTKRNALTVRFNPGQLTRLHAIEKRVGVKVAEQVRRAVEMWLKVQEKSR
jgi:hypothetical protein